MARQHRSLTRHGASTGHAQAGVMRSPDEGEEKTMDMATLRDPELLRQDLERRLTNLHCRN